MKKTLPLLVVLWAFIFVFQAFTWTVVADSTYKLAGLDADVPTKQTISSLLDSYFEYRQRSWTNPDTPSPEWMNADMVAFETSRAAAAAQYQQTAGIAFEEVFVTYEVRNSWKAAEEIRLLVYEITNIVYRDHGYEDTMYMGDNHILTFKKNSNAWQLISDQYFDGLTNTASPSLAGSGDVSLDGKVNVTDARMILQASVGKLEFNLPQMAAADMNNDKVINATDARLALQQSVGK